MPTLDTFGQTNYICHPYSPLLPLTKLTTEHVQMLIEYLIIILPLGVPLPLDTIQPYYMFREQSSQEAWSIVSLSNFANCAKQCILLFKLSSTRKLCAR